MSQSQENSRSQHDPNEEIYRADTYTELMIAYGCEAALDALKADRRKAGEAPDLGPDGGVGLADWDYNAIALTYAAYVVASEAADWWATQLREAGVDLDQIAFVRSDAEAMSYWGRATALRKKFRTQIVHELGRDLQRQQQAVR